MHPEQRLRHPAEHFTDLRRRHRRVGSQGGQDIGELLSVIFIRIPGQFAGEGMETGKIRWNGQYLAGLTNLVKGGEQARF